MALKTITEPRLDRPMVAALFDLARTSPDVPALYLPQEDHLPHKTWRQLADDTLRLTAYMNRLGVQTADRVVLWSDNRYEWIVVDFAIQCLGAIHVPLHGSLPASGSAAQIAHSEPTLVLIATAAMAEALRGQAAAGPPNQVRQVIDATNGEQSLLDRISAISPGDGMAIMEQQATRFDPQAIATILYSSGTSGEPKAVALTHANLTSNAYAAVDAVGEVASDRRLNFLPFSHIYARTCDLYTWVARGSELALARNRESIFADCRLVKPTLMNGVPYFYERIAQRVAESENTAAPITIQQILGGNIRACFCGGAPLPVGTFDFFHARGVPLLPGYGLTESSPVISFSTVTEFRRGTVGKALPGIEVRFAEDGELLTKGPHVMLEYWKEPELTRETIRDGWLYTGDLGSIDADGFISITGRKKDMIALSTGKKATPTHIEGLLCRMPFILQALVVGNDQKYLAALIVPNAEALGAWMEAQQLKVSSKPETLTHPRVLQLYQDRINQALESVAPYEQVKRFLLLDRGFTIEDGLLTPKLSMRRDAIHKRFQSDIAALFSGGGVAVEYNGSSAAGATDY